MNDKTGNGKKKNMPEPAVSPLLAPSVWNKTTFSPQWFADALEEARNGAGENSIRREIVFSSCFLESYIFERVRDIDMDAVDYYFPQKARDPSGKSNPRFGRSLVEKWKYVPKELSADKKIGIEPKLSLSLLGDLNAVRNDLVHASVSRPIELGKKTKRLPPREILTKKKVGWALGPLSSWRS